YSLHPLHISYKGSRSATIYTLSLHDALPILLTEEACQALLAHEWPGNVRELENILQRALVLRNGLFIQAQDLGLEMPAEAAPQRSEEHTSELQSRENLVCRLLLEKKKDTTCS